MRYKENKGDKKLCDLCRLEHQELKPDYETFKEMEERRRKEDYEKFLQDHERIMKRVTGEL